MKSFFFVATFALLAQSVHGKSVAPLGAGTPVQVQVKCTGMNMEDLSTVEKLVLTQVLGESFADVSGTTKGGSALTVTEKSSWRCGRSCRDDDYAMVEDKVGTDGEMTLNGYWRCGRSCRDDDDASFGLSSGVQGGANNKAWENKFVETLTAINSSTFQAVEKCNIIMTPHGNVAST